MGQIVKLLMDKTTQSRLQFLHQPTDLIKHLNPYVCYFNIEINFARYFIIAQKNFSFLIILISFF